MLNSWFLLIVTALLTPEIYAKSNWRIIGGKNALPGQFPYAAAIQVQTGNSKFFCGGALMGHRWILTSGHCVYNATLFTIQLGSVTLTEPDPNRLTLASSEYVLHPDFDPETIQNDFGLIKLRMEVSQTDYLRNGNFSLPVIEDGTTLVAIGWGQTSDSESGESEHLQYVEVSSLSNEECKQIYGDQIADTMVCVEGNFNEGTCNGDNGGPLLRKTTSHYIVGVASFISANGCESTNPSGYTRVRTYYSWLYNVIWN